MKNIRYRLICLNLALLMLFTAVLPVRAAETEDELCAAPAEWAGDGSEYLAAREAAKEAADGSDAEGADEAPALLSAVNAAQGYLISVDGTHFTSDQESSGNGWSYNGNGRLDLNNYNGGAITASGDLVIYSAGIVSVQGKDGRYGYGQDAVAVSGNLTLFIESGSFSATGEYGSKYGGYGLYVTGALDAIGVRNNAVGLSIKGAKSSSSSGVGGCAIYAEGEIYLGSIDNCDLRGGSGYKPAPAVVSTSKCTFGLINAVIVSGNVDTMDAILADWFYNRHTSTVVSDGFVSISINQYTLLLGGNGGTRGGATFTSLRDYYPAKYDLADYVFSRDGYTQVAWTDASGDMVPLTAYYTPATSTSLYARWEETKTGDILLNGIKGTFDNGKYWQKTGGEPVKLPETLTYKDEQEEMIGWHTDMVIGTDENHVLGKNSVWYAAGDTVQPNAYGPTVLYAKEKWSDAAYVLYHTTKGQTATGSDLIVQCASPGELTAIEGENYIATPAGYRFAGWAAQERGAVIYDSGDALPGTMGNVMELYAVWQLKGICHSGRGVNAWVERAERTIRLEPLDEWSGGLSGAAYFIGAAYDADGRMVSCAVSPKAELTETGFIELGYTGTVPAAVRLFALDEGYRPVGEAAEADLRR